MGTKPNTLQQKVKFHNENATVAVKVKQRNGMVLGGEVIRSSFM